MIAPLAKVSMWGDAAVFFTAISLGFGFGFFLEKAGFGSSRTLAGVWYGYNFAVVRVMFSAIVTAMLGLFGLHYLGVVNFDMVYVNPTYIWPQIVGGFIFGLGFNMAQFCPGTSAVSCSTGKIDAFVFLGGFMLGIIGFSLAFPGFAEFFNSSSLGRLFLSDVIPVPTGVIVLAVVLIALGAFAFTHYLDRILGNNSDS